MNCLSRLPQIVRRAGAAAIKPAGVASRSLGACFVALVCLVMPVVGRASCVITPQGSPMTLSATVAGGGEVTIDPNVPTNTVLAKLSASTAGLASTINCSGDLDPYLKMEAVGPVIGTISGSLLGPGADPGTATLYQSAVPGIGYAVIWQGWGYLPQQRPGWGFSNAQGSTMTIYLVKTSEPIPGGTNYLDGTFATWTMYPSNARWINFVYGAPVVIKKMVPTCAVVNSDISVALQSAEATSFSGVGTTAGTPKNFEISLNCSGGDPGTQSNVYVTLTDATNPSNTSDMLSPTAATAGTGVGIRIFNGTTAVKYGQDSTTIGNANQWKVTTIYPGNSTVTLPLTAKYVQVAPAVSAGAVSAIATFTFAFN